MILAKYEQWEYFKFMQEIEEAHKECKKWREERDKRWREDNNNKVHTNRAFEKIERFDGSNPEWCLAWMEEMFAMIDNHSRNAREELLFNSGGSVQETLYSISPDATQDQIKDILLCNHSNLKTPSQCMFGSIQQKCDEALQTYNTEYESYYKLAHPGLTVDNDASKVNCIHYTSSLYGKLGDEMEGRFNQELPDNLQAAFQRAVNFEPRVLIKQWINTRKVNEVNHINVSNCDDYQEIEVNESHIRNPKYKGKNYDPNYQKNKHNNNSNNSSSNSSGSGYKSYNNNNGGNFNNNNNKGNFTGKPANVQVTLTGPVNKEQMYKIHEILKNPKQYRDQLPKHLQTATGEYAKNFNKFCPSKVEVNEAAIDEVIDYAHFMKKSNAEMTEALDLYKALGDDVFYGTEEQPAEPKQQKQWLPKRYEE